MSKYYSTHEESPEALSNSIGRGAGHPLLLRRFANTCIEGEDYSIVDSSDPAVTARLSAGAGDALSAWALCYQVPLRENSFVIEDYAAPDTFVMRTFSHCT